MSLRLTLEKWLADYTNRSGLSGLLVGVSGGIDSMVCAHLGAAVAASTGLKLHTLGLPITIDGATDGLDVSGYFADRGLHHLRLDLSGPFVDYLRMFPAADLVVRSNIRTRLRATALYTYANIHQLLVIGTINKVELGIGYFQKHAAIGDILPLGHLSKSEIRRLAVELNIPSSFIKQKASGCVSGLTAEEEWGFSEDYADLSIQADWKVNEQAAVPSEILAKISTLNSVSNHKRQFPCVFTP